MKTFFGRIPFVCFAFITAAGHAEALPPQISINATNAGALNLSVSGVVTGSTYYLEHLDMLTTNNWQRIDSFEGTVGDTNWNIQASNSAGFYRAGADPYHAKVGQSASFDPPTAHNVSGTAHIVNNRTIELRNFYYDGGGIVVQVYVSPNDSFSPYTAISEDLYGTAFTNATLILTLPESANLDDVSYISIWCVAAGVSFGDGPFQ